jgi:hypothetical protein
MALYGGRLAGLGTAPQGADRRGVELVAVVIGKVL